MNDDTEYNQGTRFRRRLANWGEVKNSRRDEAEVGRVVIRRLWNIWAPRRLGCSEGDATYSWTSTRLSSTSHDYNFHSMSSHLCPNSLSNLQCPSNHSCELPSVFISSDRINLSCSVEFCYRDSLHPNFLLLKLITHYSENGENAISCLGEWLGHKIVFVEPWHRKVTMTRDTFVWIDIQSKDRRNLKWTVESWISRSHMHSSFLPSQNLELVKNKESYSTSVSWSARLGRAESKCLKFEEDDKNVQPR